MRVTKVRGLTVTLLFCSRFRAVRQQIPAGLRSAAFGVLHSGPSHNLLRSAASPRKSELSRGPDFAELVSCGPLPLPVSGGGHARRNLCLTGLSAIGTGRT